MNNLEFDHADIFADLGAIETQFHHLVRTIPGNGLIVSNGREVSIKRVLARGCWTPMEEFATDLGWQASQQTSDGSFEIHFKGEPQGALQWDLQGEHNQHNALAALAAARHAGVPIQVGIAALGRFQNVKRRMEVRGVVNGITVYDDFAHHPTAIQTTLQGLRNKIPGARILAVLEPRSNTMRMGVMKDSLADSLKLANHVFCYNSNLGWDAAGALSSLQEKAETYDDLAPLIDALVLAARPGDHVVIMSNGGFGGIHDKLLARLQTV